MTATDTLKSTGRTLVDTGRTGLLAAVGAGDTALEQARAAVGLLRGRAEALPGEAQVQADLAVKEARVRAEQLRDRATHAAAVARARADLAGTHAGAAAEQARAAVTTIRPDSLLGSLTGLVGTARDQAVGTLEELAGRGSRVIDDLRTQPGLRRVVGGAEQVVDTVEDAVETVAEGTADAVSDASDTVTSVAQETAARTDRAVVEVEQEARSAAATTKRTARRATSPATTPAVPEATPPTATRAPRTSRPVPDPTAVPRKSTRR